MFLFFRQAWPVSFDLAAREVDPCVFLCYLRMVALSVVFQFFQDLSALQSVTVSILARRTSR